jgi:hypothetical protein
MPPLAPLGAITVPPEFVKTGAVPCACASDNIEALKVKPMHIIHRSLKIELYIKFNKRDF